MYRTGNVLDWGMHGGADEDEDQSMGPEDHAWSAVSGLRPQVGRLPNLDWVWDLSTRDLMAHQLWVALRQPVGSA